MEPQIIFTFLNGQLHDALYNGLDSTQYAKALEEIAAYIKQRQEYVDKY